MNDILQLIGDWASRQPDKLLYSFLDATGNEVERLTYRSFLARVDVIAANLANDGRVSTGDRLILCYPPGLEMISAFFGCVRAGMIPVPVPAPTFQGLSASLFRLGYVIADCEAAGVLSTAAVLTKVSHAIQAGTRLSETNWIATDAMSDGPTPPPSHPAGNILFLQYTSGSTSKPKGVIVSHENVIANSRLVLDHPSPVAVSWLPQHHDMGLIGYYINTALGGGTLHGFSPATFIQRPALWLQTMTRVQATASSAPNFAFEYCLREGRVPNAVRETLDLGSLRFLMAAAEPVKPESYREFLQAFAPYGLRPESFVVAYGLAENTLAVSSYGRRILKLSESALALNLVRPDVALQGVGDTRSLLSCGRPLGDNVVRIVDPVTRLPTAADAVGEIWVNGGSKCLGYWGKEVPSRAIFGAEIASDNQSGSFLRTGDMGFLHEGELYVCGRLKDMLNVRGQNYYPQDVETVVEQAGGLRKGCVAAIEVQGDNGTEIVVLAEIARRGHVPDPREIVQAVRSRLALGVDRLILIAPRSLPKTSSGKLMRFRARELWLAGELSVVVEHVSVAIADPTDSGAPFQQLRAKYGLSGEESNSLIEAGVDSLDLVLSLHELVELFAAAGDGGLATAIDVRVFEHLSIRDLFRLVERIETAPEVAIAQLRRLLVLLEEQRHADLEMMAADRQAVFEPAGCRALEPNASHRILLTGATGFLGPFLLTSLLEQTRAQIECLVRGEDDAHARIRLRKALENSAPRSAEFWDRFDRRVTVVSGDLERAGLGLPPMTWQRLCREIDTIYHNGAFVNYLHGYRRMRASNVVGTSAVLRLACESMRKTLNYISTTFIFGWATKDVLYESDTNESLEKLDFGYSQTKWASEQIVLQARRQGLDTRIFRPALITPSVNGDGANYDITLRLLAFMVKHGLGVNALNQVSFMPADITANNIVAISNLPQTANGIFHVTRDDYANMMDVTTIITDLTGRRFDQFDLPGFVPEVVRRCTPADPLFPLLDFLVGSIDQIAAMKFKRYDSAQYQAARAATSWGVPDPPLTEVVAGLLNFMRRNGIVDFPELSQQQHAIRSVAVI